MANDFSADTNCVALWRLESGALTADSKGTNTLTDVNTVTADTVDYKEGACCGDFEKGNSEALTITDANLDAGFPLKSGDTNKKISVAVWFKIESIPSSGDGIIFSKYDYTGARSFALATRDTTNKYLSMYIGYSSGNSYETINLFSGLSTDRWYHLGVTFQDSDKSYYAKLWDDTASSASEVGPSNTTNNISVEACNCGVGCYFGTGNPTGFFDGRIDEVVIFNDILTEDEIDQIRGGTYGAAGGETREFAPLPTGVSVTSSGIATVIRPVTPGVAGTSTTVAAIAAILRELIESVAASSATAEIAVTVTGLIEFPASITAETVTSAAYELILREILFSLSGVSTVSEITLDVTGAAVQDQEGFRFRNDDGTEVTATWRAVQDTDISLQNGINFRLRFVINTTGDIAASQYQIEYKKSTDADWSKVV